MTPGPTPPTPQGVPVGVSGGGEYWVSSGPTSGTGVNTSGYASSVDYAYYTQGAKIDYCAFPANLTRNYMQNSDFSLSGNMPGTTEVSGYSRSTVIHGKITAYARCVQTTLAYGTSSYQQPQKFQVNAYNTDLNGNNYGNITSGCWGCMGSVDTIQEFQFRRPWIAEGPNADVAYNETTIGYTFTNASSFGGTYDPEQDLYAWQQETMMHNMFTFAGFNWNSGAHTRMAELGEGGIPTYVKHFSTYWGQFDPGQQQPNDIIQELTLLGMKLTSSGSAYSNYFYNNDEYSAQNPQAKARTVPHYDSNRHDYT